MDENTFQRKLTDLLREIGDMPEEERARLTALAAETKDRHEKLKKTVSNLQESLDYLRLSIKYLLFDLEATRRENGQLRKMLEEQAGG
jgi:septal ring factor EnvC (AmiA/AmiB activator)